MKKAVMMIGFCIVFSANLVQATMISVIDTDPVSHSIYFGGKMNAPLTSVDIQFGDFNPIPLTSITQNQVNTLIKLDHNYMCNDLIRMFERTYTPYLLPNGDYDVRNDNNLMYSANRIHGWYRNLGQIDYIGGGSIDLIPIPDLSEYDIKDLYIYFNYDQNDSTINTKIQMWADAEPVPEPSTLLLLCAGFFGLVILRKRFSVDTGQPA